MRVPEAPKLTDDDRWRVCLHEAAHAVVTELSGLRAVTCIEVFDDIHDQVEAYDALGRTSSDFKLPALRTEEWFRWDIAIDLAGMAGEELILGDRSTTSGGSRGSDITSATEAASLMVARFGLGRRFSVFPDDIDRPVYKVFETSPKLRADVDFILATEYARAKRLLEANLRVIIDLARALKEEGRLEGERLKTFLVGLSPTEGSTKLLGLTG